MLKRKMDRICLKPECVGQYREYHDNIWPELLRVYRKTGVLRIDCFLNSTELIVYVEFDGNLQHKVELSAEEEAICGRWQLLMEELRDKSFDRIEYAEVFHMA